MKLKKEKTDFINVLRIINVSFHREKFYINSFSALGGKEGEEKVFVINSKTMDYLLKAINNPTISKKKKQ